MSIVFVLLGRPGAGKTETGAYYAKQYGLPLVNPSGEIRRLAKEGDPRAKQIAEAMSQARDFSPKVIVDIIEKIIAENPERFKSGFLLDGFPRWFECVHYFEEFLSKHNFQLGRIIEFKVPKQQSIRRQIKRGRETMQTIQQREKNYLAEETAVIEYYRRKGKVKTVRTMNYKRMKKTVPEYFLPNQAKELHKIVRSVMRQRKR